MLANRLLANQITEPGKIKNIVNFLCSDSGSHDYTINRREAKNELGLMIEKPDNALYVLIKSIYYLFWCSELWKFEPLFL